MTSNQHYTNSFLKDLIAPDFTLPMSEGEFLSIQELRGHKVLLVFLRHLA